MTSNPAPPVVRLGVSACLLGENVRYDGGHKRDPFLVETLGPRVQWVPVCPEMAIGLGVPRESVRLVRTKAGLRMVASESGKDHTDAMETWAAAHVEELARARLSGFVLKSGSPSCGLFGVKVQRENGRTATRDGRGLFAAALVARFKLLPVEEEGRLEDARLRENFLERVFVYERWTRLLDETPTPRALAAFHAAHETMLLARSPMAHARLGRLVARAGAAPWDDLARRYGELLMEAMSVPATRGRRVRRAMKS
jgi:uncharacterized protein YbbK (DUF523 family)